MALTMAGGDLAPGGLVLRGRRDECSVLDGLLDGARSGRSGVLVLRGEAGVGKTAIVGYAIESAADLTVLEAAGCQAEMELAFAVLHQLCAPLLDRIEGLPAPQRRALEITFGLSVGPAPDRLFVGLAVLGLLSEAAEERPVLCVIDDAQWLDRASAQALAFVARRLLAESVVILFAVREPVRELAALPELVVEGLRDSDARQLLTSVVPGRLDQRVADQLVAEADGNPLALLELPRGLTPAELAGGFGLPEALPLKGRIEDRFPRMSGRHKFAVAARRAAPFAVIVEPEDHDLASVGVQRDGPTQLVRQREIGSRARHRSAGVQLGVRGRRVRLRPRRRIRPHEYCRTRDEHDQQRGAAGNRQARDRGQPQPQMDRGRPRPSPTAPASRPPNRERDASEHHQAQHDAPQHVIGAAPWGWRLPGRSSRRRRCGRRPGRDRARGELHAAGGSQLPHRRLGRVEQPGCARSDRDPGQHAVPRSR
jgi:AAA ATPase domain